MGKKSYTSKATVIRLCKKLGLSGYEDLRRKIELEVNEKSRLKALLDEEPVHEGSSLKDIVNIIPSIYDTAISNTKLMLDYNSINRVIRKIRESSMLDIYGAGVTYTCATTAMFKFLSIGIECNAHTGINEHYIMTMRKRKNRVAIILSFTGSNSSMIKIAKYLRKSGTFIIEIGGVESNKLENLCDEYLEIYQKQLIMSMEVLTPFISITYIFDILFAGVLVKDFNNNLKYSLDVIKYKNLLKENNTE